MLSAFGYMLVLLLIAGQLRRGIAVIGRHQVRRSRAAGPFWFILTLQLFIGSIVAFYTLLLEMGWYRIDR